MTDPIIDNERDRRTWSWIIEQVGEPAARSADLNGRRPYVSNIVKALGLKPPSELDRPDRARAQAHLDACRAVLGKSATRK